MKYMISYISALVSCGVAVADATDASKNAFHLDFSETVGIYSFDSTTIVEADTKVGVDLTDWLTVEANLPVYNNEDITGLGDIGVAAVVNLVDGKCDFLAADKAVVNGTVGIGIPLDSDFSSDNFYASVGGSVELGWGEWLFGVDGEYSFIDGLTYVPELGGFVDGDWANVSQTITYGGFGPWTVGAKAAQIWSDNGGDIFTLGPTVAWKITDNIGLSGDVGFVLSDNDLVSGDADFVAALSLGITF